MAVNKVVFGAVSIMDISDSTVTADKLAKGVTAYDKTGEKITGIMEASSAPILQEKTVTPSTAAQNITADNGYDGLLKVTVNGDANLTADNIKSGTSIFGVTGSYAGSSSNLQAKSVTYTSNGTATVTPDAGYDGLSSVDVTVDVAGSGGGGETAENVVITSSLPSYLNRYIQICGIDKDGNKILLNGYTTPVSVKKNTPLMIRVSEYPYARISGQYTVFGIYAPSQNIILDSTDIVSGDDRMILIVPTGDLNIYDAD